jgi:HEAT repeat protein
LGAVVNVRTGNDMPLQILIEPCSNPGETSIGLKVPLKRRTWIVLTAVSLAVLLAWALARPHPEDLVYEGRSLKAWTMLLTTNDAAARAQATQTIHSLGSNAVPGLSRLLQTQDWVLRRQVWNWSRRMPKPLKGLVLKHLRPLTGSATRLAAAQGFQIIGPEAVEAVPLLGRALRNDTSQPARMEAARALGAIGEPALAELTNAACANDPNVRYAAINGLAAAGPDSKQALGALVRSLQDSDSGVRLAAANSLATSGTNALPFLGQALSSDQPSTRREAAQAMTHLHIARDERVALLLPLLKDSDATCRLAAIHSLGATGLPNQTTVAAVAEALDDPVQEVRLAAIAFFQQAHWRTGHAVPGLSRCLSDGSPTVRMAAAQALADMGAQANSALPALARLTNDQERAVRTAATNALVKIQSASLQ